jgi:hypothetical protein
LGSLFLLDTAFRWSGYSTADVGIPAVSRHGNGRRNLGGLAGPPPGESSWGPQSKFLSPSLKFLSAIEDVVNAVAS